MSNNVTLQRVKDLIIKDLAHLPPSRLEDVKTALRFCNTRDTKSSEDYLVDPLTMKIISQKLYEAYRSPEAVTELVEILFYVSGNNRRLYRVIASRGNPQGSESL